MTGDAVVDQYLRDELYGAHKGRAFGGRKTGTSPGGKVRIERGGRGGKSAAAGYGNRANGVSRGAGGSRVVIKANYVKQGKGSGGRIRESARYYLNRENEYGEKEQRQAFSKEHDELDFGEVKTRLKEADQIHAYHYRLVVAPETDKEAEGGDLKALAREVMVTLEKQQEGKVSWIAVEHSGDHAHSDHAHVHVIASLEHTITKSELHELRYDAELAWRLEMVQQREMQRDALEVGMTGQDKVKAFETEQGLEL